jgi:hypothetical protein
MEGRVMRLGKRDVRAGTESGECGGHVWAMEGRVMRLGKRDVRAGTESGECGGHVWAPADGEPEDVDGGIGT